MRHRLARPTRVLKMHRVVGVLALALACAISAASARAGPPPTSPEVTVAKGATKHGVEWEVTGYRYGDYNDVWLTVREEFEGGGSTAEGASPRPQCARKVGIAGVSSFASPSLLIVNGQVSDRVASVKVVVEKRGKDLKAKPKIKFISAENAAALGTDRFGWWFASFARTDFDPEVRVTGYDKAGKKLRPAATFSDGESSCSNRRR
jgi:hypothetical protein